MNNGMFCLHNSDPYVKIYLVNNGQRVAKKKTHVKKRTLNPVFNESFVFDLPANATNLDDISLEFLVLDWDRVTKNEVPISCLFFSNFQIHFKFSKFFKVFKIFKFSNFSNFFKFSNFSNF